jgi:hypothetical protein
MMLLITLRILRILANDLYWTIVRSIRIGLKAERMNYIDIWRSYGRKNIFRSDVRG